jgi:fatty acid desaturase
MSAPLPPTATQPRKPVPVNWYRSPLDREQMKQLLARSDLLGLAQTLPHLLLILAAGTAFCLLTLQPQVVFQAPWNAWWLLAAAPVLLLHGFLCSFAINAVHELGHGTVFKTRWLNRLFEHVFAFIGWIHHDQFTASHTRHHRYTLHYPDDQEEVLPKRWDSNSAWDWSGVFNERLVRDYYHQFRHQWRVATGKAGFDGAWNTVLFPADQPELRRPIRRWAWCLVVGHGTVLIGSLAMGWWTVPLVVSMAGGYGQGIQWLLNNTQHIGMMKDVPDARLCCRTFTANPIFQYFYWHMNYHIEHHMYAAVPCYRLGALHRAILSDLPPTPHGLRETWRQINAIQAKQAVDPSYEERPQIPIRTEPAPQADTPELVPA